MDFHEKARAIWTALDDMAQKDPQSYRKFIHDQLHGDGAEEMWKQLGLGGTFQGQKLGDSKATTEGDLESATKLASVSGASSSRKRSALTTRDAQENPVGCSSSSATQAKSHTENRLGNSLSDDTFFRSSLLMNPLLAQIVAEEDEDKEVLVDLSLPKEGSGDGQSESKQEIKKPLIEEL